MDRNAIESYRVPPDKSVTDDVSLEPTEQRVEADATAGALTVTLPPVALAQGKHYSVRKTDAVANAVTVKGGGDEAIAYSNATLDAQNDRVLVYSDGKLWHEVSATIA